MNLANFESVRVPVVPGVLCDQRMSGDVRLGESLTCSGLPEAFCFIQLFHSPGGLAPQHPWHQVWALKAE